MFRVFQKLQDTIAFAFEILYIAALPSLFVGLYSMLMVYLLVVAAAAGWGVFAWVVPTGMMCPVLVAWYRVLVKRYRAYAEMLLSEPMKWDIEAAVKGWVELTKLKKGQKKRS